jgi:hypothetical protein
MQNGYTNNSLLVVSFPSQISNIGVTSCIPVSANLQSLTCTKSASMTKVKLVFNALTPGIEVSFLIEFYTNYPSI